MSEEKGFRKLIAWQLANVLAHRIYDVTNHFPKDELFGMTSQMRRAALSVCANIVEGYSRKSLKDRAHFYQMAVVSLTELEFFVDFAFERNYIKNEEYTSITEKGDECARVLDGLLKSTRL